LLIGVNDKERINMKKFSEVMKIGEGESDDKSIVGLSRSCLRVSRAMANNPLEKAHEYDWQFLLLLPILILCTEKTIKTRIIVTKREKSRH